MTATNSNDNWFMSNDHYLIGVHGIMWILNYRNYPDVVCLSSSVWSDILVGNDGYPIKNNFGDYCIGGGKDANFKAKAIEFYGVNTQT